MRTVALPFFEANRVLLPASIMSVMADVSSYRQ